jgi:hypothetical protein
VGLSLVVTELRIVSNAYVLSVARFTEDSAGVVRCVLEVKYAGLWRVEQIVLQKV